MAADSAIRANRISLATCRECVIAFVTGRLFAWRREGGRIAFLLACSPDLSPIETATPLQDMSSSKYPVFAIHV